LEPGVCRAFFASRNRCRPCRGGRRRQARHIAYQPCADDEQVVAVATLEDHAEGDLQSVADPDEVKRRAAVNDGLW